MNFVFMAFVENMYVFAVLLFITLHSTIVFKYYISTIASYKILTIRQLHANAKYVFIFFSRICLFVGTAFIRNSKRTHTY